VRFLALNEDGSPRGATKTLGPAGTPVVRYASPGQAIVATPDPATTALVRTDHGFVVAWTETGGAEADAWSVVKVARLDESGVRRGAPAALRAPQNGIDEVEPGLVRFGSAIAVTWARGTHIYVCGGCIPDHRIDLMLLDPSDLHPLSAVASVENSGVRAAGGLLRRHVVVLGTSLLVTFQLTFHTFSTPGSAAFTCEL
jgi:hypothetical protein